MRVVNSPVKLSAEVRYAYDGKQHRIKLEPGQERVADGVRVTLSVREILADEISRCAGLLAESREERRGLNETGRPAIRPGPNVIAQRVTMRLVPEDAIHLMSVEVWLKPGLVHGNRIFVNGFQSWTESREFDLQERIACLMWPARLLLSRYGDYEIYRYSGRRGVFHGWTYSYVRRAANVVTLLGSLSEREGYTLFEFNVPNDLVRVMRDCPGLSLKDGYDALDFVVVTGPEEEAFDLYFGLMYRLRAEKSGQPSFVPRHLRPAVRSNLTGWTSWYKYYTQVTADSVLRELAAYEERKVPVDVFQIDDGWEPAVGDWLEPCPRKFPVSMGELARRIRSAGYVPGLWLAPFVCERKSATFREHPDWLLRDRRGRPVRAGFNPGWSGWFYALDVYNQGFRDHLRRVFQRVLDDWGFDLVKLDFLYAAALLPRETRTRGQVMCEAMDLLRELAGDRLILGCGVPLGPAFGVVDYCRVGSDVALAWEDRFLRAVGYRERVSTANSLVSTVGRRHLNGRGFYSDPDVFILRPVKNRLTASQRLTLFRLNTILGDMVLTSDSPDEYGEEELGTFMSLFQQHRLGAVVGAGIHLGIAYVAFQTGDERRILIGNLTARRRRVVLDPASFPALDPKFVEALASSGSIEIGAYESVYL